MYFHNFICPVNCSQLLSEEKGITTANVIKVLRKGEGPKILSFFRLLCSLCIVMLLFTK